MARDVGFRAVRANSRHNPVSLRDKDRVEASREEVEEEDEDGRRSAFSAVVGVTLPQTAPLRRTMPDEEASRPQGVEDEVSLAPATRLPPVNPHAYMRW